jgi:hypothetical protein
MTSETLIFMYNDWKMLDFSANCFLVRGKVDSRGKNKLVSEMCHLTTAISRQHMDLIL